AGDHGGDCGAPRRLGARAPKTSWRRNTARSMGRTRSSSFRHVSARETASSPYRGPLIARLLPVGRGRVRERDGRQRVTEMAKLVWVDNRADVLNEVSDHLERENVDQSALGVERENPGLAVDRRRCQSRTDRPVPLEEANQ